MVMTPYEQVYERLLAHVKARGIVSSLDLFFDLLPTDMYMDGHVHAAIAQLTRQRLVGLTRVGMVTILYSTYLPKTFVDTVIYNMRKRGYGGTLA